MKKIVLFFALLLPASVALAQGPPPGMGGGNRGDGNGRPRSEAQPGQTLNLDGNVPRGNQKVSGFVVSEALTTAVEFANVALFTNCLLYTSPSPRD